MKRALMAVLVLLAFTGCKETKPAGRSTVVVTPPPPPPPPPPFESQVDRLSSSLNRAPLNYADLQNWACTSALDDDSCNTNEASAVVDAKLGVTFRDFPEPSGQQVDCFYIYPTVNPGILIGNVDENYTAVPNVIIQTQAARFAQTCRVFAPYYRQAMGGSYITGEEPSQVAFKRAYLDVAAAFEYYLRNWNNGRPVIIMGHSQGAQHASYLLHLYFDGTDKQVTDIEGSKTAGELRSRLVAALPIGFNVYTREGETTGGSFEALPVCQNIDETGCVISYRTYAERMQFGPSWAFAVLVDKALAEEGFLHTPYLTADHELACVNPGLNSVSFPNRAHDIFGLPVADGDVRRLSGTYLPYSFNATTASFASGRDYVAFPDRYTATCRTDFMGDKYLAIGFYEPPFPDMDLRGDPYAIRVQVAVPLGLHLMDFNLALDDLVEHVRRKSETYLKARVTQ